MNILYSVISFNTGGTEKLLSDIMNNWKYSDDKVILCIINEDYTSEMIKKLNSSENVIIQYINRKPSSRNVKFLFDYLKLIRKYNVDVIHCNDKESLLISIIAKLRFRKLKLYYTIHDTKIYLNTSNFEVFLEKIFVKKFIAISEAVKSDIISKGISSDKIRLIYNGIDFSVFKKHNLAKRKEINIVCVARIMPQKKGQDILIKSIDIISKKYPYIKCYFAGTYSKEDKSSYLDLLKLVDSLGLKNKVEFLGNVEDVPTLLSEMDIFVLPSRFEGFGLSLIEAMAAKVRVIASNIDGPKEIIKNRNIGYLFECENVNSLCNKLEKVINETDIEDKLNIAYKYAYENYSIDKMVLNLKDTYLEENK